jgi:nucleotide-binding universal stress UspA family protein
MGGGNAMYTHILVTLDGSRGSEAVLPHAIAVARAMRAKLTLMRVVDPVASDWGERGQMGRGDSTVAMNSVFAEQAETYLDACADTARAHGIEVSTLLRQGQASKQIVDAAKDAGADAIAIATRSRRGINKLVFGSVAEEVLHRSNLPVLLVRQP